MSKSLSVCPICGREVREDDEYVKCSVCGAAMHKDCVDEEVLSDAEGNIMCPYDAALAAIDWLDAVLTMFSHALKDEQREEIITRLKTYIDMLSKS